jgi:hypothetical protein
MDRKGKWKRSYAEAGDTGSVNTWSERPIFRRGGGLRDLMEFGERKDVKL